MLGGILLYTAIAGSGTNVENKGAEIILLAGGKKMRKRQGNGKGMGE